MKPRYIKIPQELTAVHSVFHIYMLEKCLRDPSVIVPTKNVGIKDNLFYEGVPIQILDRQVCKFRTKEVVSVKFFRMNKFFEEATWEAEEDMKKRYPHLFETGENSDEGTKLSYQNFNDYL